MNYQEYLLSPHWRDLKLRFLESKYRKWCYVCHKRSLPLEVHHKTYESLGREKLIDLLYLCRDCHESVHQYLKLYPRTSLRRAARRLKGSLGLRKKVIRNSPTSVYQKIACKKIKKFLAKLHQEDNLST